MGLLWPDEHRLVATKHLEVAAQFLKAWTRLRG
jgi:hypothetical protein